MSWRKGSVCFDDNLGEESILRKRSQNISQAFSRGNIISTIDGKSTATQYFHRRVGAELSMKNHTLKPVKAGIGREGALKDNTSYDFVGDVEARVLSCQGARRWEPGVVINTWSGLFISV